MSSLKLDTTTLSGFRPAQAFSKCAPRHLLTSLDFDDTGEWLVTCSTDDSLQVYDCRDAKHSKTLFSKKYGCHLARFTHRHTNVVYASTKENDTLRYLSLHDNSYVRYFKGHTDRVTTLEPSPLDDTFLSAAADDTVRLWDLRSPDAQGLLNIPAPTLACWDPTGAVFVVASQLTGHISLYDVRTFDRKPFATFHLSDDAFLSKFTYPPRMPDWSRVEVSNDGKLILVATAGEAHYVVDAFSGALFARLVGSRSVGRQLPTAVANIPNTAAAAQKYGAGAHGSGDCCFAPDGKHVVAGNADGSLCIWDLTMPKSPDKSLPVAKQIKPPPRSTAANLFGGASGGGTSGGFGQKNDTQGVDRPALVAFNPRYAMLATGDTNLYMWLPTSNSGKDLSGF